MKYENLIFDLDGTISDPKVGIVRSLNYALEAHSYETRQASELCQFIGPPLDHTFSSLVESSDSTLIQSLVSKYRERYADIGYAENTLYSGIPEALRQLNEIKGLRIGICTSKRADFAKRIIEMFSLQDFFCFVNGGDVGIEKWQQLEALLEEGEITQNSIMIGDRFVDITAAHKNNLLSAGVLWGYGSEAELTQHNPLHLLKSPDELTRLMS